MLDEDAHEAPHAAERRDGSSRAGASAVLARVFQVKRSGSSPPAPCPVATRVFNHVAENEVQLWAMKAASPSSIVYQDSACRPRLRMAAMPRARHLRLPGIFVASRVVDAKQGAEIAEPNRAEDILGSIDDGDELLPAAPGHEEMGVVDH